MRLGAFAVAQLGQMRRNENVIIGTRRCRPHRTRPCIKRKDGAPSVMLASEFNGWATRLEEAMNADEGRAD